MSNLEYIGFSTVHRTRIGELVNHIANRFSPFLYSTKLIKLLFLIDEISVKQYGVPITWLEYHVYDKGPLPRKLWLNVVNDMNNLEDFIIIHYNALGYQVLPYGKHKLTEFSDFEIQIINDVLDKYGSLPVDKLIDITHQEGGLWSKIVKEKKIKFKESDASPYIIDFRDLIKEDKIKIMRYENAEEEINMLESIC